MLNKLKIGAIITTIILAVIISVLYLVRQSEAGVTGFETGNSTSTNLYQSTKLPIIASLEYMEMTVRAYPTNTGYIYIGNSSSTADATFYRWTLYPGESINLILVPNYTLYYNVSVSGEGVSYITEYAR